MTTHVFNKKSYRFLIVAIVLTSLSQNVWSMELEGVERSPNKHHMAKDSKEMNLSVDNLQQSSTPPRHSPTGHFPGRMESPRVSPRKRQHCLWFFDQDELRIQGIPIAEVGQDCLTNLQNTLMKCGSNIVLFVTRTKEDRAEGSDDVDYLERDCGFSLSGMLEKNEIIYEITHSPEMTLMSELEVFCRLMNKYDTTTIAVYGISDNRKVYLMLAYWLLPKIITQMLQQDDAISINRDFQDEVELRVNEILVELYQRVLPDKKSKPSHYLSEGERTIIKNHCMFLLESKKV